MSEKRKRRRTIKTPPKARPKDIAKVRAVVANNPPKRTYPKQYPKKTFGEKVQDFFMPKHFGAEVARGMQISSPYGCGTVVFAGLYWLGRAARKMIDPRHKMFGQGEKNET